MLLGDNSGIDEVIPGGEVARAVIEVTDECLHHLGWSDILAALSSECATELAQERATKLGFLPDREAIELRLRRVGELIELTDSGAALPIAGVADIFEALERCQLRRCRRLRASGSTSCPDRQDWSPAG